MFRDDRDALAARVESLERQLREAREQNTELSQENQEAERELKRLQKALRAGGHAGRPALSLRRYLPLAVGVVLVGAGALFSVRACAPETLDVAWRAKSDDGRDCRIELRFTKGMSFQAERAAIRCGDKLVFERTNLESLDTWTLWEGMESPGWYHYRVKNEGLFNDIEMNTWEKRASVPGMKLVVEEFSELRSGPPLHDQNKTGESFSPMEMRAEVEEATGQAPIKKGASCTVSIRSHSKLQNCRILIQCGDATLYGGEKGGVRLGFNKCEVEGGKPVKTARTTHEEAGGDPVIVYDLSKKEILLEEDAPAFTVKLRLQEK